MSNGDQNGANGQSAIAKVNGEEQHVAAVIDECTETIAREVAGLESDGG